ncbi:MAG: type I glyceraldehyde-3-phosphate dehydrogenase [Deltaproteobacteria bacterium]|nr:type I glyceraldehyde-3-phosphate dehydrogenase [Deltaproteobacteria bacterium]
MAKVAINGMGRIGRAALKIIMEKPSLDLVAVNDLMPLDNLVYLLRYDTVYGRYGKEVKIDGGDLMVGGKKIKFLSVKDPTQLPWKDMGIEVVFECTGVFTNTEGLNKHVQAGAQYVVLSAPPKDTMCTIVHGVTQPPAGQQVFSCASCTTNCIAPVVEILGRRIGIKKAIMTTIHAYTSSQLIVDGPAKKFARGRAGAANFVPTSTGAAKATTDILPEFKGKFDGVAVRGPVACGSLADIVMVMERSTTAEEVNNILREEAESPRYKDILGVAEDPLVSSDIIKDPRASVVELSMTQVVDGDLLKVMTWYDNEWGYTNQMIREALRLVG